jgi:hypothetical protein
MPFQRPPRPLSVLASAVAAGIVLAVAGCGHITPLGPDPEPVSLPPPRQLASPIIVQVMRNQPPTTTGRCPVGSVDLFGLEPNVLRVSVAASCPVHLQHVGQGSTATPTATPTTLPALPVGVACYRPVGRPVTITSAAVSSVTTYPPPPDASAWPATYGFVVAFPTADVAAVTAVIRQAYDSGDATGISVAGKLWQAPQIRKPTAGQGVQITLLSRNQAFQLYRLLVPSG